MCIRDSMYAQIIDDTVGKTLVSASTLQKDVKAELENTDDVKAAAYLGTVIGKKAVEAGIESVVFDRGAVSYTHLDVYKRQCYVLDAIRGKDVQTALGILTYNPRYASSVLKKLLESAIANAENNNGMSADNLYVAACYANKGPTMKRIQPRAQGRAYRIEKRTSHITIVLDER